MSLAAPRPDGFADVSPEKMAEARRHNTAGNTAFQAREYTAARREFEQAYALLPLPDFLRSLAKVAEKQSQLADAIRFNEEYLRAEPAASDQEAVKAELAELKSRQAALQAAPSPPPVVVRPPPSLVPPIALLGSGLALLAVGGGLGIAALNADKSLTSPENAGMPFTEELAATYSRGKALNAAAISIDVVAGVTLAAGVGWLAYTIRQRRQDARVSVQPAPIR